MLLEEKFLEFHRYASSHNLPLEAISVGDENKVLCEMHYAANAPRNIYSHTKSFTVTAVGLAMEEGKLSLEDHVAEVFKDKLPSNPDPNLEKIQLKHLLCMSSGFGKALLMNADRRPGVGAPDYEKYMMGTAGSCGARQCILLFLCRQYSGCSYGRTGRWQADGRVSV